MNYKRIISLLSVFTMLTSIPCFQAYAEDAAPVAAAETAEDTAKSGKYGIDISWSLDSEGKLTISGKGLMDVKGDEMIQTDTSMESGYPWYNFKTAVKSVEICEGITNVAKDAFKDCINLKKVSLPDNLTRIEAFAFSDCAALEEINIPDSVEIIDGYSFQGCKSLKTIVFPVGLKVIGFSAFAECNSLEEVEIPGTVSFFSGNSFMQCANLKKVVIDDGVDYIPYELFSKCDSLEEISIPASIKIIEENAFERTPWLEKQRDEKGFVIVNDILVDGRGCKGDVVIPDGIKVIADGAFGNNEEIESVVFSDSVSEIGRRAFILCKFVREVILPENLEYIYDSAFRYCDLTEITIPDSVKLIEDTAFADNTSLSTINISETFTNLKEDPFFNTAWYKQQVEDNGYAVLNGILLDGYKCKGDVVISDNVTRINRFAFRDNTDIKSVTFSDSVKEIEDKAFASCENLQKVVFSDSVEKIGANVFEYCEALSDVTLPKGLKTIDYGSFSGCISLKDIVLPEALEDIVAFAFYECDLRNVVIPSSVKNIDLGAFDVNKNMETVTVLSDDCDIVDLKGVFQYNLDDEESTIRPCTLIGHSGSTVEKYAEKYGHEFKVLDDVKYGDANCDGSVDIGDSVLIMQSVANPAKYGISGTDEAHITAEGQKNGDVSETGDGITNKDALAVQKYMLKLISKLPE